MALTIEQVSDVAREFAKSNGYPYSRLESVEDKNGVWTVILDPLIMFEPVILELKIKEEQLMPKVIGFARKPKLPTKSV